MDSNEHRDIGDVASAGEMVDLGGKPGADSFWLSYGDVMALSGDYFMPDRSLAGVGDRGRDPPGPGTLFSLAAVPGEKGTRPESRDELVCALKVMAVDEDFVDPRFEPDGEFADFTFSRPGRSDLERRVRDRYLELAATNDDHFLAPGGVTHERRAERPAPFGSAILAYGWFHQVALEEASRLGHSRGDLSQAMAREAAAQHFLTDALTAGHLRTPVAQIRRYWRTRYPEFWENLQSKVAADTARTLRELAWALRLLPASFVHDSTLAALKLRTSRYPQLSLGDFLARLFHDWDNCHGLTIDSGGIVFGDGNIHRGVTRELALSAASAGIDDVQVAFELGAAGGRLTGERLYGAVRAATGAHAGTFLAQTKIPAVAPENLPQNWRAPAIESLWDTPIVGNSGTTVGAALTDMLHPDGRFIRQLDRLGQGLVEPHGLLRVPLLGHWLVRKGRDAYHHGFIEPLAAEPKRAIFTVLDGHAGVKPTRPPELQLSQGDRG